jgi:PAS domain S-box-containing protein
VAVLFPVPPHGRDVEPVFVVVSSVAAAPTGPRIWREGDEVAAAGLVRDGHDGQLSVEATGVGSVAACPLVVDGRTKGVVLAHRREPFGRRRLRALSSAATDAAAALDRIRLDDAERRSRLGAAHAQRHLALLAAASGTFAPALDDHIPALEALGSLTVPEYADCLAIDLIGAAGVPERVVDVDGDRGATRGGAGRGLAGGGAGRWMPAIEEVIRTGTSAVGVDEPVPAGGSRAGSWFGWPAIGADGVRLLDDDQAGPLCRERGLGSFAIVPIRSRGLSLGAMTVGTRRPRRGLRLSDVRAFEEIAIRCALVIERVLLYAETRAAGQAAARHADQLRLAVVASQAIAGASSVDEALRRSAREAGRALGASWACARVSRDGVDTTFAWPASSSTRTSAAALSTAARITRLTNEAARDGPESPWIAVPLTFRDGPAAGFLLLESPEGRTFSVDDQALLLLLGRVTSAAIEQADLYEAAASSEQRLRTLVEAAPLAIMEIDVNGKVLAANRAATVLFGIPDATAGPMLVHPATDDVLAGLRERVAAGETIVEQRMKVWRIDGASVDVSASASALVDGEGRPSGLLAVLADVSERQELEQQLQHHRRMEAVGRLAGGVAHDFNNLLTVIIGYSDLIARRLGPDHALAADIDAVRAAGQRAADLTEKLLTISRRRVVEATVIDPNAVVVEIQRLLERVVGEDIVMESDLDQTAGRVKIDQGQLEQVLLNLVVNARDALPHGGRISISTRTEPSDDTGPGGVVLVVSDTGVGMDPSTIERCFEPFFTTKERTKGTGLGLATVYSIVAEAGGRIAVESAPGEGATFRIWLPCVDAEETARPPRPEIGHAEAAPGSVLLVEDERDVRAFARKVLTLAGYDVHVAASGTEALSVLGRLAEPPDLLISDVVMPGMSGIDLAAAVRNSHPEVPVLFVSGYADATRDGAPASIPKDALLAKPFSPDELLAAVRRTVAAKPGTSVRGQPSNR